MSKSKLVLKLAELTEALGGRPETLAWAHLSVEELKQRIAKAQAQLEARQQDASDDSVTSRNDADWYTAGGTRN